MVEQSVGHQAIVYRDTNTSQLFPFGFFLSREILMLD